MSATNKNHDVLIKRIDDWQYKLDGFDYFDSAEAECLIADCRAALTKKYVPMTDAERNEMMARWYENHKLPSISQYIEAEIIRRAGLEVQE